MDNSIEKLVICEHGYTFTVPMEAKLTETEGFRDLPTGIGSGRFVHKCKLYDCELEAAEIIEEK